MAIRVAVALFFHIYWMYYEKEGVRYYLTGINEEGIEAVNYNDPEYTSNYPVRADGNGTIAPVVSSLATIWTGVLYKKVSNSNKTTRLAATKAALKEFVDNVFADGKRNNVTHKVSIVTFSGSSSVSVDWTELNNDASVTTLKSKIENDNFNDEIDKILLTSGDISVPA